MSRSRNDAVTVWVAWLAWLAWVTGGKLTGRAGRHWTKRMRSSCAVPALRQPRIVQGSSTQQQQYSNLECGCRAVTEIDGPCEACEGRAACRKLHLCFQLLPGTIDSQRSRHEQAGATSSQSLSSPLPTHPSHSSALQPCQHAPGQASACNRNCNYSIVLLLHRVPALAGTGRPATFELHVSCRRRCRPLKLQVHTRYYTLLVVLRTTRP